MPVIDQLLEAMDIVAAKRLSELNYDKTLVCTIADNSEAANGVYKITENGTVLYEAQSENTSYKVGDQVFVLFPSGFADKKQILGRYASSKEAKSIMYVDPADQIVGTYEITNPNGFGLIANGGVSSISSSVSDPIDLTNVDSATNSLYISADFQSFVSDAVKGNYGLRVWIDYENGNTDYFILDSESDMFGNPYDLMIPLQQSQAYILTTTDSKMKSLDWEFYQQGNFFTRDEKILEPISDSNLFVKNIKIILGYETITKDNQTVEISTVDPLSYGAEDSNDTLERTLNLSWFNKDENNKYIGFKDGEFSDKALIDQKDISIQQAKLNSYIAGWKKLPRDRDGELVNTDSALENYIVSIFESEYRRFKGNLSLILFINNGTEKSYFYDTFKVYFTFDGEVLKYDENNKPVYENVDDMLASAASYDFNTAFKDTGEYLETISGNNNVFYTIKWYSYDYIGNTWNQIETASLDAQSLAVTLEKPREIRKYKFKAEVVRNGVAHQSNTIEFESLAPPNIVPVLTIVHGTNSQDVYPFYDALGPILDKYEATKTRTLSFTFIDQVSGSNLETKKIEWAFSGPMLIPAGESQYRINSTYIAGAANKVVLQVTDKEDKVYEAEKFFTFSTFGNSGTPYTLIIQDIQRKPSWAFGDNDYFLVGNLLNEKSEIVQTFTPEDGSIIFYPPLTENTSRYTDCIVAEASATIEWQERQVTLKTLYPIGRSSKSTIFYQGPSFIVYDSLGCNPKPRSYDLKILNEAGNSELVTWTSQVYVYDNISKTWVEVTEGIENFPVVNSAGNLSVKNIYAPPDNRFYCVLARAYWGKNLELCYAQPILITQNPYGFELLNNWNGEQVVDAEGNYILSAMLGAGKMGSNNTFTGVVMGDIGKLDDEGNVTSSLGTGLYGFQDGISSFGFKTDGTGFIGANYGKISFDGNNASINLADIIKMTGLPEENENYLFIGNSDYYIKYTANQDLYIKSKNFDLYSENEDQNIVILSNSPDTEQPYYFKVGQDKVEEISTLSEGQLFERVLKDWQSTAACILSNEPMKFEVGEKYQITYSKPSADLNSYLPLHVDVVNCSSDYYLDLAYARIGKYQDNNSVEKTFFVDNKGLYDGNGKLVTVKIEKITQNYLSFKEESLDLISKNFSLNSPKIILDSKNTYMFIGEKDNNFLAYRGYYNSSAKAMEYFLDLQGTFRINYNDNLNQAAGFIGKMEGSTESESTEGIGFFSGINPKNYFFVSEKGAIMRVTNTESTNSPEDPDASVGVYHAADGSGSVSIYANNIIQLSTKIVKGIQLKYGSNNYKIAIDDKGYLKAELISIEE